MDDLEEQTAPESRAEWTREFLTMMLYIALSLDAVIVGTGIIDGTVHLVAPEHILWVGVSLMAAHILAFQVSTRFVGGETLGRENLSLVGAQLAGGTVVTALAVVWAVVIGSDPNGDNPELLLEGLILVVAYLAARRSGQDRLHALGYVLLITLAIMVVLAVKAIAGH